MAKFVKISGLHVNPDKVKEISCVQEGTALYPRIWFSAKNYTTFKSGLTILEVVALLHQSDSEKDAALISELQQALESTRNARDLAQSSLAVHVAYAKDQINKLQTELEQVTRRLAETAQHGLSLAPSQGGELSNIGGSGELSLALIPNRNMEQDLHVNDVKSSRAGTRFLSWLDECASRLYCIFD